MSVKNLFKITFILGLAIAAAGCSNENAMTNENAVCDAIMARRSIRHYKDTPVSRDTLMQLAIYGINAPNAMNKQEWALRIVDSKEYLDGVTELMKAEMPFFVNTDDPQFRNGFRNAPAVIMIAAPDDEHGMTDINIGLLSENICLAAQSMGLGSIVMGGPSMFIANYESARPYLEKLDLPEGYKLKICLGVGYADEAPEAKPRDEGKIEFID